MIHIIHQLRKTSGRNAKIKILEEHRDNEPWQMYLGLVYDPFTNYYISSVLDLTYLSQDEYKDFDIYDFIDDLSILSTRSLTGNNAKEYANELSQKYGELFRLVLEGNIRAGVNVTTINKVYDDLIPTFNVMLGKDVPIKRFPVLVSTKFDGVRVLAFVENGTCILRTRSGKRVHIQSLEDHMKDQMNGVYDGELVDGEGKVVHRTKISGLVNKCMKGTAADIKDYRYMIFDCVGLNSWDTGVCGITYGTRYDRLSTMITTSSKVRIVEQEVAESTDEVNAIFNRLSAEGYEGIIARYPHDPYYFQRTEKLIKKKAIRSFELICTDVQEGAGKYEGMIGALILEGEEEGYQIRCEVGSGMTDVDRDKVPEEYIGKTIPGHYNEIVKSKNNDYYSLFLPRFDSATFNRMYNQN